MAAASSLDGPSPRPPVASSSSDPPSSLLYSTLPPPPRIAVVVRGLTIQAPVAKITLPLVPIEVPRWKKRGADEVVPKNLVNGVSATVQPGEVLAIVGGSGSGKTTFLNVLAGRAGNLQLPSGSIDYVPAGASSTPLPFKQARKRIGYVRQTDDLLPYLTVRETLAYAAALRLPRSVTAETRSAIVDQTIMELGLADAADVVVGGAFRKGISGGEKRRLSIGCVLVTLPSILCLDEPTTGLDAFTAFALLETLKRLAQRGRSIILSIHQPRSDAFPVFDRLVVLSQGSVVFSDRREALLPHFASLGYTPQPHTNPLDFVIDVAGIDNRTDEAEEVTAKRVGELVVAWREYESRNGVAGETEKSGSGQGSPTLDGGDVEKGQAQAVPRGEAESTAAEGERPGLWRQTSLLTRRGLLNVGRNPGLTIGFAVQAIVIGVVVGLVFLDIPETTAGIQSLKTVCYYTMPCLFYLSIVVAVFLLCQELIIFDREREDNLYSTVPWVASLVLSYLPANVIFPTLYAVIVYFMTGMRRDNLATNVLSFIANAIMQQQASWGYALLATSINRSFAQASLLANGFSIIFVLSAGYLLTHIPGWIRWSQYVSPYFYGFHWIARLQFGNRDFACDEPQCSGEAVLVGLRFNLATPLWVYPVGLLGFIVVSYTLGTLLLNYFHPGGIKHATAQESKPDKDEKKEKEVVAEEATELIATPKERRGVDVVVDNLQLSVRKRDFLKGGKLQEKVILESVNARFPAGQVSTIMGPSGAGKSSLLQILAGRLKSGALSDFRTTGSIKLNGREFTSELASVVAFVQQEDDHHLPALTVRETLRYAARLRLKDRPTAECDARAEEVLRMLGLKQCADNIVGGELVKGISGGEKRRLSLAVELLSDPDVLYADEPLSGLDAFTAQNVMQSLRDLASEGRTIIVSVHQPRSDIWQLFDNVLLLVKGGQSAYSGPISEILEAFEDAGETCPKDFNPADFILDVVSIDHRSVDAEQSTAERVARIVKMWEKQVASQTLPAPVESSFHESQPLKTTPIWKAFPVVLSRSFRNLRRQPDIFFARALNPPFLAILFWLFFLRLHHGASSSQDIVGLLQEMTALPFVGMLACLSLFPAEKQLFFHEFKTSARHSAATFVLAYTLQETIVSLISSLLWSFVFCYGMGMNMSRPENFPMFWISSFALISAGESIGIMFCAWTNNGGLAVSLVSAGLTLLAQLNGIISVTLAYWLKVIGWISPMKPSAAITIINEMRGTVFSCTPAERASGACVYETGEQLLETFNLPRSGTGKYMGILLAVTVLWRLFAWGLLAGRVRSL